jgi:hypothetical protein
LRKRVYYSVENDEGYLAAVMVFAGDEKHGRKSSPNLRRKFAGMQVKNFGERWRELRAAARDKGYTSETRASRATPAYI